MIYLTKEHFMSRGQHDAEVTVPTLTHEVSPGRRASVPAGRGLVVTHRRGDSALSVERGDVAPVWCL